MKKNILLAGSGLGVALVAFFAYVSTRDDHFHYERNGFIHAAPGQIFPYLSEFKKGDQWNPYSQKDPKMKRNYVGEDGKVGAVYEFEGNSETGSGKLELLKIVPNQIVEMKLIMTSPMHAENIVHYELTPEKDGTRFSWSMEGQSGFMGKLVSVFIDCEKMVAGDFEKGIANLKSIVEGHK